MRAEILDTNIILRFLLGDDQVLSPRASAIMERIKSGEQAVIIDSGVLTECVFVLQKTHRVPRDLIVSRLIGILSLRGVLGEKIEMLMESLAIYRSTNLSIVDSILLQTSREMNVAILTFDKQLLRLSGRGADAF